MFSKDMDLLLARAQVFLAILFATGFLALTAGLIFFHSQMSTQDVTLVTTMLTVMGTLLTLQMNFFYARQRPQALPDPSTTTITTPAGDNNAPLTTAISVTRVPPAGDISSK